MTGPVPVDTVPVGPAGVDPPGAGPAAPGGPRTGRIERLAGVLAARTGIRAGQWYTVAVGAVVAVVLGATGLPPVVAGADRADVAAPGAPAPAPGAPTAGGTGPVTDADPGGSPDHDPARAQAPAAVPTRFRPPPPPSRDPEVPAPLAPAGDTPPPPAPAPVPPEPEGTTTVFARVPPPGAPEGVAVAPDGTVWVATNNAAGRGGTGPGELVAYTPAGVLIGSFPVADQPEDRTVGLTGLAVDARGRPVVADAATGRVLRLDPGGSRFDVVGVIPDVPPCVLAVTGGPCEPGALDAPPEPRGVWVDPDGTVLVADRAQGIVWRVGAGDPTPVVAVTDRLPGEGPFGVTVDDRGVVVSVTGLASTVPPGDVGIVAFDDGAPTVLATWDRSEGVGHLTAGAGGRLWVTLPGADAVRSLTRDGDPRTYDGGAVTPGFDAPVGVTLGDGHLYVTSQSTVRDDPDAWVIHRIRVDDRPRRP